MILTFSAIGAYAISILPPVLVLTEDASGIVTEGVTPGDPVTGTDVSFTLSQISSHEWKLTSLSGNFYSGDGNTGWAWNAGAAGYYNYVYLSSDPASLIIETDLSNNPNSVSIDNFTYYPGAITIGDPVTYNLEFDDSYTNGTPTPEPCTLLLLGSGLVGLAAYRKRCRKA